MSSLIQGQSGDGTRGDNKDGPFDLYGTVVKYIRIAVITFIIQCLLGKFTGHPKRVSDLIQSAIVIFLVSCALDRFVRPWLVARRVNEEARRAESERWRMN